MGLHRSGTHALREYLRRFFDIPEPEPRPRKKAGRVDAGTVELAGGYEIWKHAVPVSCFGAPAMGADGGPAVIFLTVRDPASWMSSLSNHAYEIFPKSGGRRQQGGLWWMFEEVTMSTGGGLFADPFANAVFRSVPELWAAYVRGYLTGAMAAAGGPVYLVVRFEDIVQRPGAVVNALAELGLPRNDAPFAPIEESASGARACRAEVAERIINRQADKQLDFAGLAGLLRERLAPHAELLQWLDYDPL